MQNFISKKILTLGMDVKTVTVSEKGQIALPATLRKRVGIKQGDTLLLVEDRGKIFLAQSRRVGQNVVDDFADLLKHSEKTAKKLWGTKSDDVWNNV